MWISGALSWFKFRRASRNISYALRESLGLNGEFNIESLQAIMITANFFNSSCVESVFKFSYLNKFAFAWETAYDGLIRSWWWLKLKLKFLRFSCGDQRLEAFQFDYRRVWLEIFWQLRRDSNKYLLALQFLSLNFSKI